MQLHSDQGRNFSSNIFTEMCHLLDIKKTQITPYHPQSDGLVERFNRTLATQWDEYVRYILMAYRTAVHESTKTTSAKLMMVREIRDAIDLVFGRPNTECFEGVTKYDEKLAKNIEEATGCQIVGWIVFLL